MFKKVSKTRHYTSMLTLSAVIAFFSYLAANPLDVAELIRPGSGLAAVGMNIGVAENPYSRVAAQLQDKELRLAERQQELDVLAKKMEQGNRNTQIILNVMTVFIMVLSFLLATNFYLDHQRRVALRPK